MKRHKLGETGCSLRVRPGPAPSQFPGAPQEPYKEVGRRVAAEEAREHDRQITQEKREIWRRTSNLKIEEGDPRRRHAQFKEETAEARRTRVIGDMVRTLLAVAALPGAQSAHGPESRRAALRP